MDKDTADLITSMKNTMTTIARDGMHNAEGVLLTNCREWHDLETGLATVERRIKLLTANPATRRPVE